MQYFLFYFHFRQTSKAAALFQQQQAQQAAQQAHQQAQQQKQQQQSAVMSALPQLTLPTDTQPSQDYSSNELQIVDENGEPVNWQDDPNEPRYCLCNQVSYGEMVGCDNNDVSFKKC